MRVQACMARFACTAFRLWRERSVGLCLAALVAGAMLPAQAAAQSPDEPRAISIIDEIRIGAFAHNIESNAALVGSEKGVDINFELLFARPSFAFGNPIVDTFLRPRLHIGSSINVDGYTNQGYAGLTWNIPLPLRLSLELTFGGTLHDGPLTGPGKAFGCPVNFRESLSLGYAVTERWRLYGTWAHMSNDHLCGARNSGLTSGGVRLGYVFN